MSDTPASSSQQNRADFAALAVQLTACSDAMRAIVVNVLRDGCISTMLASEISALQAGLQRQATDARRLLGQWPEER